VKEWSVNVHTSYGTDLHQMENKFWENITSPFTLKIPQYIPFIYYQYNASKNRLTAFTFAIFRDVLLPTSLLFKCVHYKYINTWRSIYGKLISAIGRLIIMLKIWLKIVKKLCLVFHQLTTKKQQHNEMCSTSIFQNVNDNAIFC
jgi:hypothetical protein